MPLARNAAEPNPLDFNAWYRPEWRNGRRGALKMLCSKGRVGSNPTFGTTKLSACSARADLVYSKGVGGA